ncbi:hypothetical protein [Deinococcus sp. DB0503]|uniref:hypothetical protein n=1 Tax=Deinococcus sp. DB0503 TaxID=2479203 RepID=UPI001E498A2F|nr:hypothetical protein [Deinococcus sp. DB0503]MBI0446991.1 hypothetical protein [Deinococcus sp. DB0503]
MFLLACVVLAVLAAYAGGALGYLIALVTVGVGLIVSLLQRILVAVRRPDVALDRVGVASASGLSKPEASLEDSLGSAQVAAHSDTTQMGGGAAAAMRGAAQRDGQVRG